MHRAGCQRWDLRRSVPSAQHMVARASAAGAALKGGKLRGGTLPRWDRVADEASSALCERGGCNNPPSSSQAMNRRGVKQPCSDHPICGQHQLASVLDGGGGGRLVDGGGGGGGGGDYPDKLGALDPPPHAALPDITRHRRVQVFLCCAVPAV